MDPTFRTTTAMEKLLTSTVNAAVAVALAAPLLLLDLSVLQLKLIVAGMFLFENLEAILFHAYRLPGMRLQGSYWKMSYPLSRQLIHALLYTLSFSTLLFWMVFPGDLLLFNLLCLQLPCVLLTGSTLHGWLAGNMVDIKPVNPG